MGIGGVLGLSFGLNWKLWWWVACWFRCRFVRCCSVWFVSKEEIVTEWKKEKELERKREK